MGLLDGFSDPTTQGLLGASAALFNAGGPSNRPTSFGQALGAGFQGFTNGADAERKRRQEAAMAEGAQKLQQLQIIAQTGTIEQQQVVRMQAAKIKADLMALSQGDGQAAPAPMPAAAAAQPQQAAPPIQPGPNSPILPNSQPEWARPQQQQQPMTQPPAAAPKLTQKNLTQDYASRLLQEAEVYSRNGDFDGADKRYQAAAKLLPKVNKIDAGIDPATGKMVNVITFEDGTQKVSEFGVKPDFTMVDSGGKTTAVDKNALTNGQMFTKTATPGEMMSNSLGRDRLKFDKDKDTSDAAGMQYMDTTQGIVALPKKLAPGQAPAGMLVNGPDGKPLEKQQKTPEFAVKAISSNANAIQKIDNALTALKTPAGKDGVGYKAYLPQGILNRYDPEGTNVRADISDVGSLVLHDRSGAAVTASETPRLIPFIPLPTDDAETARKKLVRFKQVYEAENNNLTFQYPQAKGLADYASGGQQPAGASAVRKYNPATGKIE